MTAAERWDEESFLRLMRDVCRKSRRVMTSQLTWPPSGRTRSLAGMNLRGITHEP
jgi:hypothetical protein